MQKSDAACTSERPEIDRLFDIANKVGGPGTWALALAAIATAVVTVRAGGVGALLGAMLLVVSSAYFAVLSVSEVGSQVHTAGGADAPTRALFITSKTPFSSPTNSCTSAPASMGVTPAAGSDG